MPHVLLIRPLCEGDEPEFAEPLGIERLAGYLRAAGAAETTVLDRRLYQQERRAGLARSRFWDDVREACAGREPDVVGLSLMTSADVPDALRIISRMRSLYPAARLVAGGLYVTTDPKGAQARLPHAVTLLAGEGELSLLAFVTREPRRTETLTPDGWAPAYRPDLERYAALGCAVNMQTSRGCPGACTFCATPQLGTELRRWQPRSLSLVVDEMEAEAARLERAGLPAVFNFVDDDFGPLERVEELAYELRRRQLRVAFALEMRLASLIGQTDLAARLSKLHEAGLTRVFVGVESLNPGTLRRWHKAYDVTRLPEVLAACAEAGITLQAGYILWHADQTVTGACAEVEALARMGLYSHRAGLSRLIVFPGCALAEADSDSMGFQRMDALAERFYQQFCEQSQALARAWTSAALREPYEVAKAHLTGDETRVEALRHTLDEVNVRSLELFRRLAHEELSRAGAAEQDAAQGATCS